MKNNRASVRFTAIIFVLTALMLLFCWVHSCFPASVSSQESNSFYRVFYWFFGLFGAGQIVTQHIVRKLAHFSEFAAVGGLLLSCAYCFDRRRPQRYAVQVLFAGLSAALIDETIQLFIEGRAGMIADVWIDLAGVVTGALLLLAFYAVYRRTKRFNRK
ncbi:MAG: VanZ family protein [Ruminococcus sp.]|nr:VanZ family protein [Ruminococcus sp.]